MLQENSQHLNTVKLYDYFSSAMWKKGSIFVITVTSIHHTSSNRTTSSDHCAPILILVKFYVSQTKRILLINRMRTSALSYVVIDNVLFLYPRCDLNDLCAHVSDGTNFGWNTFLVFILDFFFWTLWNWFKKFNTFWVNVL